MAFAGGAAAATPTTIFEIGDLEPDATWYEGINEFDRFGYEAVESYDFQIASLGVQNPDVVEETFPAGLILAERSGDGTDADFRSVVTLTIRFNLLDDYEDAKLEFARFGIETDKVIVDGGATFTAPGLGEGVWSDASFDLGDLAKGPHTIAFGLVPGTGGVGSDTHVWDHLLLTANKVDVPIVTDTFIDDDDSVFEGDIEWMAAAGITKGCNPPVNDRFCPDSVVTRGQMAAFLVRALGLTEQLDDPFIDDDDSIFEDDIEKLAAAGITKGCNPGQGNTKFCPDNKVTRGQMAAFLTRAFKYTDNGGGNLFIDDDDSIFEDNIDRLGTAGVTRGCNPPVNDRFCPDGKVTRGQMAAFLNRALG